MNWYKKAEAEITVTPEEFWAMSSKERLVLARNINLSPQTQQLFFTAAYIVKEETLNLLAQNTGISPETQKLFFAWDFEKISRFSGKEIKRTVLRRLSTNPSISPDTQMLFLVEEYLDKDLISSDLASSFRVGLKAPLTREQLLELRKLNPSGIRQLLILKRRLRQVRESS
jgi:hypothetical protein